MKTACVTGAAGGLGIEAAKACVGEGYRVFATDLKETERVRAECEASAGMLTFLPMDVTKPGDVEAFGRWVERDARHIDLLINTLGIYTKNSMQELEGFDIEQTLRMMDVNTLGPLRIVKRLIPLIIAGEEKVVVNISSEAGSMAAATQMNSRYDYGMSKAALNMQTTILQRQYGPQGVKFLLVHPGWLKTEMGRAGGSEPTVEPRDSAAGILALAHQKRGQVHDWMYYDYNGTPRPW